MKPNFAQMSKAELKAYVLANRDDTEAIRFLFRVPPGIEVKRYPAMYDIMSALITYNKSTPPPTPPRKRGGETKHSFGGVGCCGNYK